MTKWKRGCGIAGWTILLGCLLSLLGMFALSVAEPSLEAPLQQIMLWVFPLSAPGFILVWIGQTDRTHRILCGEYLRCPKCNYDLTGLPPDSRRRLHCPECGDHFGVEYIQEHWKDRYLGPRNPEE
jgi:hypothetical protein